MARPQIQRNLLLALMGVAATGLGVACSSSGGRTQGADPGVDVIPDPDKPSRPEYRLGYQLKWQSYPRVTSRKGIQFFDLLGDTLTVHDFNNNLSVLETTGGGLRWATVAGKRLDNFVGNARAGNRLLVSADTTVVIFNIETGELIDYHRLAYLANTPPVIVDALAIYGCTSGEVLAHNIATGFKQWAYGLHGTIIAKPVHLAGFDVGAVSDAGDVVILDAREATANGRLENVFDGIDNNPVADDFAMYVASRDQSIYAFARSNGERLWRYRTEAPITAQPTVHDGVLYVHLAREGMVAIDTRSGSRLWANKNAKGRIVAMRNGRLIAWDGNAFTTIDPERGESIETIPFPDVQLLAFETFEDGALYTVSRTGLAQKFIPAF